MNDACCGQSSFQRYTEEISPITDPGKTKGVEFTLGTCKNCKQFLMSCYVAGAGSHEYEVIDRSFVEKLRETSDSTLRKKLLADWWNSL